MNPEVVHCKHGTAAAPLLHFLAAWRESSGDQKQTGLDASLRWEGLDRAGFLSTSPQEPGVPPRAFLAQIRQKFGCLAVGSNGQIRKTTPFSSHSAIFLSHYTKHGFDKTPPLPRAESHVISMRHTMPPCPARLDQAACPHAVCAAL